ncbi:MAG: HAD-IIIA family hydrolase [Catenulisporales bacterium]|nr:HAD-IIIA family hydrolase [Catenulisporales bacterium]
MNGGNASAADYAVVVPTVGRTSLQRCVDAVASAAGPPPRMVVIADDRPPGADPLPLTAPALLADRLHVVSSGGRGPAAARNAGWRLTPPECAWIVFLDDDVEVARNPPWRRRLAHDLDQDPSVGGVQGLVDVPLPERRSPTDWERNTAALADARWITADMAYRRAALVDVGGFDERFRHAYREDTDLALRVQEAGWRLEYGTRRTSHPVRPNPGWWASVRAQRGNADDALMRRLHSADWHLIAGVPIGRRPVHALVTATGLAAAGAFSRGRRAAGAAAAVLWAAGTAEFAMTRIRRGPHAPAEIAAMVATSVLIPPAAVSWYLAGVWRYRTAAPWPRRPAAVLFDRDGTLVRDVPFNTDPALVEPMPGAVEAVRRLRGAGIRVGVVTNQSGIARGLISPAQLEQVNERVEELFGPFDAWAVCPHVDADRCDCRKPAPGLVTRAAERLGVETADCVVVGDIEADIGAARAAGARAILVPVATASGEAGVPEMLAPPGVPVAVARDLPEAVDRILAGAVSAADESDDDAAGGFARKFGARRRGDLGRLSEAIGTFEDVISSGYRAAGGSGAGGSGAGEPGGSGARGSGSSDAGKPGTNGSRGSGASGSGGSGASRPGGSGGSGTRRAR